MRKTGRRPLKQHVFNSSLSALDCFSAALTQFLHLLGSLRFLWSIATICSQPSAPSWFCVNFWENMKKRNVNSGRLVCKGNKSGCGLERCKQPGPPRLGDRAPGVGVLPASSSAEGAAVIFLRSHPLHVGTAARLPEGVNANAAVFAKYVNESSHF